MSDLVAQLSESITTASTLCGEIKKTRHIGKSHTQLDLLEASLASRPSSLSLDLSNLTIDGSSSPPIKQAGKIQNKERLIQVYTGAETEKLETYVSQMSEINSRLEHIAHPKKHSHSHSHHHQKRSLLFPDWDPARHEHKEMEDPHFGELRTRWEGIREGVEELLEGKGKKVEVEEVTESLEVKLEIKEEVKEQSSEEESKAEETKEESKIEKKTEAKEEEAVKVEPKEVIAVKVDEVVSAVEVKA